MEKEELQTSEQRIKSHWKDNQTVLELIEPSDFLIDWDAGS